MTLSEKLIFLLCGPGVSFLVIYFFLWLHYRPLSPIEIIQEFFRDIGRAIFNFFHYFFGYSCIVCGKKYFSAHKAHNCCIHKTELHFKARQKEIAMMRRWEEEYGAMPEERRRKRRERFIGHFQRYQCRRCGKKHWKAVDSINCCKNKPTPPHINTDGWLRPCPICHGDGDISGAFCDFCNGRGYLP